MGKGAFHPCLKLAWVVLQMCKMFLRGDKAMPCAVAQAREWARFLVNRESRGPGDRENAMRRIAQRHGLNYGLIWSLLYRPPKDMMVSKFMSLRRAYLTECERQESALRHEREIAKAKTLFGSALLGISTALDRAADSVECPEERLVKKSPAGQGRG